MVFRPYAGVALTLLMPYYRVKAEPLPAGFDSSLFPDGLETVPKRAVILRTKKYIHHCDYMIVYDAGQIGNTRNLMLDAQKIKELRLENIALILE